MLSPLYMTVFTLWLITIRDRCKNNIVKWCLFPHRLFRTRSRCLECSLCHVQSCNRFNKQCSSSSSIQRACGVRAEWNNSFTYSNQPKAGVAEIQHFHWHREKKLPTMLCVCFNVTIKYVNKIEEHSDVLVFDLIFSA